jgi:hypothetical protein
MKSLLTQINADLAENPWLEEWVSQQKDQSWGWQAKIETILPLNDTSAVLQQLLSDKKIVNQMTQYRDLLLLTDYLAEKEEGLQLWLTLVDKREQKSKTRVVIPVLNQAETDIKAAKRELKSLQNYLQQSDSEQFALPNDKEEKKTQLLSNTASRIERLMQVNKASRNMNVYQQRWLRVKGVFLWQMNDDRKNKQWHLKKQLVAMNRLIKRAEIQLLETRLANQWSPAAWVGMKEKVVTLLGKTSALKKVAEQAKAESKRALITDSKTYLSTLTHRINDYLSQTRLSIARLYDEALQNYVASGELKERSSNND